MAGPHPIAPQDIRFWQDVTGTILRREECAIIFELDAAYRTALAKERADQDAREKADKR